MSSRNRIGFVAVLAIAFASASARAQSLGIGDPAPKIEVKSFVKGEPIKSFETGKNYVVEFWATWCGPCRTSIPHLTELQKKHPDVSFIGVSVFEQDQSGVEPFVKEMGDKMAYRVAVDAVPAGKDPAQGAMAKSWMEAAKQEGIPTAFIVNKDGKIAWIGHPMAMEKPLEKVIDGTWDLKVAAEEGKKEAEARSKQNESQDQARKLLEALQEAQKAGDFKKVLSTVDEIVKLVPNAEPQMIQPKIGALMKLDQQDKALEFARKIEKSEIGSEPVVLNALAWSIIDPDLGVKPNAKLLEYALDTAKKADEKADQKVGEIADTLGKAYFDSGDPAKALETQERAVRLLKESGEPVDKGVMDRLEQYKKAVEKK
jgi:thiol-disulfide isomerase/thioredoxin